MVIAYVESNFLLEITFGQAEAGACEGLLELAEQDKDFSTADIERALAARQCEFFGSFEKGLMRVRSRL